jgi:glycosyl transferase family 4
LRILHLSHEGLPDWRIEKSAITATNKGHEPFFAGGDQEKYNRNSFLKNYNILWTAKARLGIPYYWYIVKKQFERILREIRPDIVHAHNIFSAKMISEFKLPFVYDDHEYWSKSSRFLSELTAKLSWQRRLDRKNVKVFAVDAPLKIRRNVINYFAIRLWSKWEQEVVSSSPTITVSDKIAKELRTIAGASDRVFVVPNFPMTSEVQGVQKPIFHDNLSSVYAGSEGLNTDKYPFRNIELLPDFFEERNIGGLTIIGWEGKSSANVTYKGYMPREAMFEEMAKHSLGLLPWTKHWSHSFLNPNKAYEYAHAGLFVICTSTITPVIETLKENCATFEDYADLGSQMEYYQENLTLLHNKRLKLFKFARDNLIWERFEKNIFHAYQSC